MFGKNKSTSLAKIKNGNATTITKNTSFEGTLTSDGTVNILGPFKGEIETAGRLIVGKSAEVSANIKAKDVQIDGVVRGNIDAKGKVEIFSGGKVYGDINSYSLSIEEGAIFSGRSQMRDKKSDKVLRDLPEEPLAEAEGT